MRSRTLLIAIVLSSMSVVTGTSSAADEISLKINGGTVRQTDRALLWEPDGGTPEVLDPSGRDAPMHWTLSAGYFDGDKIALWRGNAGGATEYWAYTRNDGKWQLTDKAKLGSISGMSFDEVRFSSVRVLELLKSKRVATKFEITDEPRGGDRLYRKVLRNELEWTPSGTHVGNEGQGFLKPPISLKIGGGTVKQTRTYASAETYLATLYWEPDGGTPEVLHQSERNIQNDPNLTLNTGYFEGNKIALWRVSATNATEYWGFTKKDGKWQLTDLAMLESITVLNYDKVRFSSVRVLELLKSNRVVTKFEITDEPRGGDQIYRKVLRNELEWDPYGTYVGTEIQESMKAQAQAQRSHVEPVVARVSDSPTPPVEIADFAKLKDSEPVKALLRGDLSRYETLIKTDDPAALRLLFRVYTAAKKEGIYWNRALWLLSKSPQTWVMEEIWDDFWSLVSSPMHPHAEPGSGAISELIKKPKYILAAAVVRIGDAEITTRLWNEFPRMSPEDQMVVAIAAYESPRLGAVQIILNATKSAKTREIADALVNSASQLVAQALADPARREGAMRVGEHLKGKGLAREFLLKMLK